MNTITRNTKYLLPLILSLLACGSDSTKEQDDKVVDDPIPCPSGNCGDPRFRSAVPRPGTVRIQLTGTTQARTHTGVETGNNSQSHIEKPGHSKLEALSPALLATQSEVEEINQVVDGLFEEFDYLASQEPEIAEDDLHVWRAASTDNPNVDEILAVAPSGENSFDVTLLLGETGASLENATPVIAGTASVNDAGNKEDFEFVMSFDASEEFFSLGLTGEMRISGQPLGEGGREIWYDFANFGPIGGELENRRTTYWAYGLADGALEYLTDLHDEEATAYVRWDENGGRYDHHLTWSSPDYGIVDEIVTNCWALNGSELFDAFALIDQEQNFYGELDGEEEDCAFGPVDSHPYPEDDFVNLPGEGEWQDIDFAGAPNGDDCTEDPFALDCPPLCDDAPSDPECVPWCEDEPTASNCLVYCDWVDDPDFCDA